MELTLYVSALLLIAISFIHSYLGERYILMRLFKRDNLPKLFGARRAGTFRGLYLEQ